MKKQALYSEVGEFVSTDLGLQPWEFQIIIPFNLAIPLIRLCPSTTLTDWQNFFYTYKGYLLQYW